MSLERISPLSGLISSPTSLSWWWGIGWEIYVFDVDSPPPRETFSTSDQAFNRYQVAVVVVMVSNSNTWKFRQSIMLYHDVQVTS